MTMTEKENNQQNIIEDLTVNEAEAEEVKGGPHFFDVFPDLTEDVRPNPDVRTVYNPYITVDYIERTPK
jgi:hypothetical protein